MITTKKKKTKKTNANQQINDGGDIVHISQLKPDPANVRKHNPRNIGMITSALQEVGAARSGVIDETGRVLAGNATLEALAQAGIERVKVIDAKGDEWVVVRRKGLTEKQKVKLAIYDNRTSELADWDLPVLENLDLDLSPWFLPYELIQIGIVDRKANDPNAEYKGMPEFQQDGILGLHVIVRFRNSEDLQSFARLVQQKLTDKTKTIWFPPHDFDGLNRDKVITG